MPTVHVYDYVPINMVDMLVMRLLIVDMDICIVSIIVQYITC